MDSVSLNRTCHFVHYNFLSFIPFRSRSNDVTNLDTTFTITTQSYGHTWTTELKPNGSNIQINESNKKEYVQLFIKQRFIIPIEQQLLALQKGFSEIIPLDHLKAFNENEVELLLSGMAMTINVSQKTNDMCIKYIKLYICCLHFNGIF